MEPAWLTRLANANDTHCMSAFNANQIAKDVRAVETAASRLLAMMPEVIEHAEVSMRDTMEVQEACNKLLDALTQFRFDDGENSPGPKNREHYNPQESPPMYPLELDSRLHINLWSKKGEHKWTVAMFVETNEGYDLRFLGDRPFDSRIDWAKFKEIATQGQALADERYRVESAT